MMVCAAAAATRGRRGRQSSIGEAFGHASSRAAAAADAPSPSVRISSTRWSLQNAILCASGIARTNVAISCPLNHANVHHALHDSVLYMPSGHRPGRQLVQQHHLRVPGALKHLSAGCQICTSSLRLCTRECPASDEHAPPRSILSF